MTPVMYALGSSLGDRAAHLQAAVDLLAAELTGVRVSPVYETAPVGGPAQQDYLNAVLSGQLADGADPLEPAHRAERSRDRRREVRWGPRTLDVDVVTVGEPPAVSDDPRLTLPHPRAHERAFVLVPWLDLEPAAVLPGRGAVRDLPAALDRSGVRLRRDLVLRSGA